MSKLNVEAAIAK